MPPKTNKQREKLEQSQASSRSKAQDLLRGTTATGAGFVGFSNFARPSVAATSNAATSAAGANPFASFSTGNSKASSKPASVYSHDEYDSGVTGSASSAMYDGADHDIAMALKMLSKKGTVTKIKALNSLITGIIPQKTPPEVRGMVGHFAQLYTFEIRDQKDRKVRQLLNEALLAMATKLKPKAFVPHLRRLLPYWLMAMHDPNGEAGAAASKALEALFPGNPEMQAEVIVIHLSAIMEEYTTFFQHTPETFPGVTLPESDEREERYERCVAAAVLGIDKIIHLFAQTGNLDKLSEQDKQFTVAGVVSSDKFGRLVAATSKNANFTRDAIRKATYKTIKSLVTLAFPVIQAREEYFGKLVLGALSDKHPSNQQELWDMVLTFLQAAAPTLWSHSESFAKFGKSAVLPRLFAQVRHGFYGSARNSFPVLLPLLSMIPLEHVMDSKSVTCAMYTGVMENAWKFVASSDGRFYEEIVIQSVFECQRAFVDYFLRSPTNQQVARRLFAAVPVDQSEGATLKTVALVDPRAVASYVGQFEKVTKDALLAVFTSPRFSTAHVMTFALEWLKMVTTLATAEDPVSGVVAKQFVAACEAWLAKVLETLPSNRSVQADRVVVFLKGITADSSAQQSLRAVGKQMYQSCLAQLKTPEMAAHALELMNGLYEVLDANDVVTLHGDASEEEEQGSSSSYVKHYQSHIQPLVVEAGRMPEDELNSAKVSAVLSAARHFFLLVEDKKAFVLQFFQDFGVQYGNLAKAARVVEKCFQFPFTASSAAQWLASGSFHASTEPPVLGNGEQALSAVWKGKLLDEFVMISVKGRLDDHDSDAFSSLLKSCLGGQGFMPVVSPDVVVILSHFATQQGERSDVAMRILPSLVGLFSMLHGEGAAIPGELTSAEEQVYLCLFHLAAKSIFKAEAEALWKSNVVSVVATKWTNSRRLAFLNSLSSEINSVFAASTNDKYSSKIWASYVELYLDLAVDDDSAAVDDDACSSFALINRLTVFDLRFEGSRCELTALYDRLLCCLAELCEDDTSGILGTKRLAVFFEKLVARDPPRGLKLLRRLVDIDLCHGLTLAMLQQQESMAPLCRGSLISPVEYISLRPLYASLGELMTKILANIRDEQADHPRYRKVLFLNQQTESDSDALADDVDAIEDLADEDHAHLDALLTTLVVSFLPIHSIQEAATAWIQQPRAARSTDLPLDHVVKVLVASTASSPVNEQLVDEMVAKSTKWLPQWPSPGGVQALQVFTTVWSVANKNPSSLTGGFDAAVHHPLLLKMSRAFATASQSSLEEWVGATGYLCAAPLVWGPPETLESDTKERWSLAVRGLFIHALAGKPELSQVARLRLHKRVLPSALDDGPDGDNAVTAYSQQLVRSRRIVAELLHAMVLVDAGGSFQELPVEHREALVSTLFISLAESLAIKARVVTTYLGLVSAHDSLAVIQLSAEVDALLDATTHTLPSLLAVVGDVDRVKILLLESFGSLKSLAACFNNDKSSTPPHVRALLYTICTYTGVFKASTSAAANAGIDINADDEAATEAALAKSMIPAGLRAALKASFSSPTSGGSTANSRRPRRHEQRHAEEEEEEEVAGRLLVWDLFIQLFPDSGSRDGGHLGMRSSALSAYVTKNGLLNNYLSLCGELLLRETGAQSLVARLKLQDEPLFTLQELDDISHEWPTTVSLAARSFFRTVLRLPAMVRTWWNDDCSRSLRSWASKYFEEHITPYVLTSELDIILKASGTHSWDADEMTVKGSKVSREITTTYVKDECALEMVIRVPSSYPLRSVEVECTRRIGITEDRWRRWVLQIIKVTSAQDGSLLDAVLLWKQNVDKEFEGVEPCPICYSILNTKTMGLPNLSCKTCANKYHNSCLYKWFNQSGKNKCPVCQQPFT